MEEITVLELLGRSFDVQWSTSHLTHCSRKGSFSCFNKERKIYIETCSYASDWRQWHEAIKTDSRSNNSWHDFPHQSVIHRTVMCMFLFNWWVATRDKASFEDWRALWTWWSIKMRKRRKSISISNVCVRASVRYSEFVKWTVKSVRKQKNRIWESIRVRVAICRFFFYTHEIGNKREYPQVNRRRWDEVNQALCLIPITNPNGTMYISIQQQSSTQCGRHLLFNFLSMLDWFLFLLRWLVDPYLYSTYRHMLWMTAKAYCISFGEIDNYISLESDSLPAKTTKKMYFFSCLLSELLFIN